jgi:hypothetical protein
MSKPDWPSIKSEYVETTLTLAEVQAKWNVPRGTLSARATRENWNDLKQQFAAKLEVTRREKMIAKRAEEQAQYDNAVLSIARGQLGMIARQMHDENADAVKVLKLANALEKLQRIGSTAFCSSGQVRAGVAHE